MQHLKKVLNIKVELNFKLDFLFMKILPRTNKN